jgi:hypothetical protein
MKIAGYFRRTLLILIVCGTATIMHAQTDLDYDMMSRNQFCTGAAYNFSSWKNYWEGTFKRDNENLGTVSTQMMSVMGNYGLSKKVNLLFSLPYVITRASRGTMRGMSGLQDLTLMAKWKPLKLKVGPGKLSLIGVGGFSFPVSNYVADHLPLALGSRSKIVLVRAIADYELGNFFVTTSGTFMNRSNIRIDRTAYYTTEMHLTNEVEMPNAASFNFRTGYRSARIKAEAVVHNQTTLGGFDITKNNMPFPSNRMNMTSTAVYLRYFPKKIPKLSVTAESNHTIAGRNAGQATSFSGGAFYIFDFSRKSTIDK